MLVIAMHMPTSNPYDIVKCQSCFDIELNIIPEPVKMLPTIATCRGEYFLSAGPVIKPKNKLKIYHSKK